MSNKISKTLLLWSVLGSLLFASAVPPADAFPKPPAPKSANHLEGGKQSGWIRKINKIVWTTALVIGVGVIGTAYYKGQQHKQYEQHKNLVLEQINETEVAQSLVEDGILFELHSMLLSGEDQVKLVYYTKDGEARIGWLDKEKDFFNDDRLVLPYKSDYKSWHDVNPADLAVLTKYPISDYSNHSDYLPFFLNNKNLPIYEIVASGAIAGKLLSSVNTLYATTFSNEDGQELSGIVFATISPLEAKQRASYPSTYVILVTHRDGQELETKDRYFTIMPDDLPDEYDLPPRAEVEIDLF